MVITLPPRLESALAARAHQSGETPETVALDILCQYLMPEETPIPVDEWERRLFAAAVDCGVSIPDSALSSDGLYD